MSVRIDGVVALTRLRGGDVLSEVWRVREEAWEGLDGATVDVIRAAVLEIIPTWRVINTPYGWRYNGLPSMRAYAAVSVAQALLKRGHAVRLTQADQAVIWAQDRGPLLMPVVWPGVMINPATGDLVLGDEPSHVLSFAHP